MTTAKRTSWTSAAVIPLAACLTSIAASAASAEGQPRRPPAIERRNTERVRAEEEAKRRANEEANRKREAEAKQEKEKEEEPLRTFNECEVLTVRWDEEIRRFIESAPEKAKLKGWEKEIFQFERDFRGRTPAERELSAWYREHIGAENVRISSFRGALREVSDIVRLRAEGYTDVVWNNRPERITANLADRTTVEFKTDRIVDIIATRPIKKDDPRSGERVYIETKNADLGKALSARELKLLESNAPVEDLVRHVDRNHTSRVFNELVRDIWLAKTEGRVTEWKVNSAPGCVNSYLTQNRISIDVQMYH